MYLDKLIEIKFINRKYFESEINDRIFNIDSLIIKNSWGQGSSNWTIGDYTLIKNNRLNWNI